MYAFFMQKNERNNKKMELVTKKPRGTEDKLPKEIYKWHTVEKIARNVAEAYGCKEIRTPTFEHTELFQRGVGGTTDVVQKEMYTFNDKKGRSITLSLRVQQALSVPLSKTDFLMMCFRLKHIISHVASDMKLRRAAASVNSIRSESNISALLRLRLTLKLSHLQMTLSKVLA